MGDVTPGFPRLNWNPEVLLDVVATSETELDIFEASCKSSAVLLGGDNTF